MYCRECGHQTNGEFCESCGFRPENSHRFCNHCGAETKRLQELCTSCGSIMVLFEKKEYAGFWIRFAARLIDFLILGIPIFIGGLILAGVSAFYSESSNSGAVDAAFGLQAILYLIYIAANLFYYSGMHASKWQGTLGKQIVGVKVTEMNGNRISFGRAIGRYFATFLSGILYIGYIIAGFTEKKQALHDYIASTVVVKK